MIARSVQYAKGNMRLTQGTRMQAHIKHFSSNPTRHCLTESPILREYVSILQRLCLVFFRYMTAPVGKDKATGADYVQEV